MSDEVVYLEMTPERKAHWRRVSDNVIDLLKSEFKDPVEACAFLRMVTLALEDLYDVKDSFLSKERIQ